MKTQNPWMGRAKGSAGGMTASKVYNKNVLKAKAFEVNNPNTAAQQNQRTFFKEVSDLVNQLTEEQCRFLCPKAPKGMSRRNFLSKQLASYVTTSSGQKVVDLANVTTLGNAKEAEIPLTSVYEKEGEFSIEWEKDQGILPKHMNEYPSFLIINIDKKEIRMENSTERIDNEETQNFSYGQWSHDDEKIAIMFLTGTLTPLTGFGTMIAAERPKK